jgi:hypothetical protein
MAIENLVVVNSDIEKRGGLRHIALCELDKLTPTFSNTTDVHGVALAQSEDLANFDLKQGTGSLSTSGSKENGVVMFEHTISFYVPNCSTEHFSNLQDLLGKRLAAVVVDHNDNKYCVGISEAYGHETGDNAFASQMYATLTSIEGGTGAALGEENGVTVTISCSSGELPRIVTSTVTVNQSSGTVTLS